MMALVLYVFYLSCLLSPLIMNTASDAESLIALLTEVESQPTVASQVG